MTQPGTGARLVPVQSDAAARCAAARNVGASRYSQAESSCTAS